MSNTLYCRPSDILTPSATITVTAGSEDTNYPRTNLQDTKAHTVSKGTGTTITFLATFGGAKTLQAVACINTNATAIQLTNGAGLNQAIAIPTVPEDGHPLDPWIDLRQLGLTSSSTWSIALTGPTGVGIGELLLVQTLRTVNLVGQKQAVILSEQHASSRLQTDYGVQLKYSFAVRQRSVKATASLTETLRADLLSLQRSAAGGFGNFLLIPDDTANDALYVDLTTDARDVSRDWPLLSSVPLEFLEQQKGLTF